jgi:hypothetical protein
MKCKYFLLIFSLFFFINIAKSQTGPWAKYDAKMKGEALIRESDGGYLTEIKSIVDGGGDVNWQMERSGLTPLMAAASGGKVEVVKFLLEKGADPNRKDANGRTALQRAQLAGAKEVTAFLSQLNKEPAIVTLPVDAKNQKPVTTPGVIQRLEPAKDSGNTSIVNNYIGKGWAPFGSYRVGQKVKFFIGSWKEGTIIEIGIPGDYSVKNVAPKERKYLIAREGAPNWNDWVDWGSVTGLNRDKYWTDFFIGDWRLGETMAVNTRKEGIYQRDEYSFHAAKEALVINENKTYRWKTIDRNVISGKWKPADDGAGVVLLNAYRGVDWVLRNETNAAEENIRGIQSARLTTNGKMSITAKRPL